MSNLSPSVPSGYHSHHAPFSRRALQLQKAMSGGSDLAGGHDLVSAAKVSTPPPVPFVFSHCPLRCDTLFLGKQLRKGTQVRNNIGGKKNTKNEGKMLFFDLISFLTCRIAQPHERLWWPEPRVGNMRRVSNSTAMQWLCEMERVALADVGGKDEETSMLSTQLGHGK